MANIINLLTPQGIDEIRKDLGTSAVVALKRLGKVVTGKTARSVRTTDARGNGFVDFNLFGGGGMKYIIDGKKANTKMPVEKKGDKFELVQELKDWKAVVGFNGPDFLLARAIAKEPRDPVDVASKTLEVYQELYGKKTERLVLTVTTSEIREEFKKIK